MAKKLRTKSAPVIETSEGKIIDLREVKVRHAPIGSVRTNPAILLRELSDERKVTMAERIGAAGCVIQPIIVGRIKGDTPTGQVDVFDGLGRKGGVSHLHELFPDNPKWQTIPVLDIGEFPDVATGRNVARAVSAMANITEKLSTADRIRAVVEMRGRGLTTTAIGKVLGLHQTAVSKFATLERLPKAAMLAVSEGTLSELDAIKLAQHLSERTADPAFPDEVETAVTEALAARDKPDEQGITYKDLIDRVHEKAAHRTAERKHEAKKRQQGGRAAEKAEKAAQEKAAADRYMTGKDAANTLFMLGKVAPDKSQGELLLALSEMMVAINTPQTIADTLGWKVSDSAWEAADSSAEQDSSTEE